MPEGSSIGAVFRMPGEAVGWSQGGFSLLYFLLDLLDFHPLAVDLQTQISKQAHIEIRDIHQCKAANKVASPIGVEQLVTGDRKEHNSYVVTEAVFAGEQVETLARRRRTRVPALVFAKLAKFAKNVFMSYGPTDARNGDRQQKQPGDLHANSHHNTLEMKAIARGMEPRCRETNAQESEPLTTDSIEAARQPLRSAVNPHVLFSQLHEVQDDVLQSGAHLHSSLPSLSFP
jgi:hypothetical protein